MFRLCATLIASLMLLAGGLRAETENAIRLILVQGVEASSGGSTAQTGLTLSLDQATRSAGIGVAASGRYEIAEDRSAIDHIALAGDAFRDLPMGRLAATASYERHDRDPLVRRESFEPPLVLPPRTQRKEAGASLSFDGAGGLGFAASLSRADWSASGSDLRREDLSELRLSQVLPQWELTMGAAWAETRQEGATAQGHRLDFGLKHRSRRVTYGIEGLWAAAGTGPASRILANAEVARPSGGSVSLSFGVAEGRDAVVPVGGVAWSARPTRTVSLTLEAKRVARDDPGTGASVAQGIDAALDWRPASRWRLRLEAGHATDASDRSGSQLVLRSVHDLTRDIALSVSLGMTRDRVGRAVPEKDHALSVELSRAFGTRF